jgi:hypothetical protein
MKYTTATIVLAASLRATYAFSPAYGTSRSFSRVISQKATALDTSVIAPVAKKEWMTPIKEGATVPNVVFKTRVRIDAQVENPFDWKDVTSEDYFKGKRVVLFSLPGAFTPTCSSTHLPGYEAAYEEMKALGIDEVYCLSVNDAFVMRQWGIHQG